MWCKEICVLLLVINSDLRRLWFFGEDCVELCYGLVFMYVLRCCGILVDGNYSLFFFDVMCVVFLCVINYVLIKMEL